MPDSLFASLTSMLDKRHMGEIAVSLGEPEPSVSRGMQASIAAILSSVVDTAGNPSEVQQLLDHASNTCGDVSWSSVVRAVSDSNSPLIACGLRLLPSLFGSEETTIMTAVSRETGLRSISTSTLMAMAAPMVMSFLSRQAREIGIDGLCRALQQESSDFREALPAGLREMFTAGSTARYTVSPVVAQAVRKEQSNTPWLAALGIAALIPALIWVFNHTRRPGIGEYSSMATGSASRVAPDLGTFVTRKLPNGVELRVPENGVESLLLVFLQDPRRSVNENSRFDFDRLLFNSGSTRLQPASQEQIDNIAAILKAYPKVRMKVDGYTDNIGSPAQNLRLSQGRAEAVVSDLEAKGVSPNRLTAEGYGEKYPIADNSTEEGRARNRRVSMRVTQK
jgi:OOP family OmpA-OmpF porin